METRQKIETRIALAEERFLLPLLYPETIPFAVQMWEAEGEPVSHATAVAQKFQPVQEGVAWGKEWGTAWFRFQGEIPAAWAGAEVVALVDLSFEDEEGFGREGQIWFDGVPAIAVSRNRKSIPLRTTAQGGEKIDFYVEASGNPPAEWHWHRGGEKPAGEKLFRLQTARLARFDRTVFDLLMDFRVCREALLELPETGTRRARLLRALDQVCRLMERGKSEWVPAARTLLAPLLAAKNGDTTHHLTATGHAHIDTAWCWPLRETIRKCARTFSTALAYMELYPDYRFSCSQPVQYLWMKKWYPSIFEGIRAAVQRGQWEPIGSMWVEPDCNVPSGESFIRQLIHGKGFFLRELGVETTDLWLPDVFGYSAALPQILRKAGVDRFLTQKISWNDTNRFPHHTFWWEGLDGTRIFSHFPPVDTYNAFMTAKELTRAERQFAQKDISADSLIPFGQGDGGGGPTIEMIERIRRWKNFEGMPRVDFGTVRGFFDTIDPVKKDAPVWVGELYLELHRGTYTSQAHNKLMNRRSELLLRDAEFFEAICAVFFPGEELLDTDPWPERTVWDVDACAPEKENSPTARALDRAWKLVLLNQFHDILPGSSIGRVYQDSRRDYQVITAIGQAVVAAALAKLVKGNSGCTAFNTLAHPRREVIDWQGKPALAEVPAGGCAAVAISPALPADWQSVRVEKSDDGWTLANGIITLHVTACGEIASLRDLRTGRELLQGPANELHLLRDYPNRWSAWDIEGSAMEDFTVVGRENARGELLEASPLRAVLAFERPFGQSLVRQKIILRAGSSRIDFVTTTDWQERDRVLKVSFPLALRAESARCETQFGQVSRPLHRNTSWDAARFEIPVQRWIDLSEGNCGVALLNNGTFGCDALGGRVRLTLLKAGSAPDPEADRGLHERTFSLFPHLGDHLRGEVSEEALALNVPLLLTPGQPREGKYGSWISLSQTGVYLESLKVAEDRRGLVVRCVEWSGRQVETAVKTVLPLKNLREVDLLERPLSEKNPASADLFHLTLRPFDIRTFRCDL